MSEYSLEKQLRRGVQGAGCRVQGAGAGGRGHLARCAAILPPAAGIASSKNVFITCNVTFRVWGFGFRVPGFKFRVSGLGFRVSDFGGFRFGFRVSVLGFRVSELGFEGYQETSRVQASAFGFRVSQFGFRVWKLMFGGYQLGVPFSGFRLQVSGFRFRLLGQGSEGKRRTSGCGLRVAGCGLRVAGYIFWVPNFGLGGYQKAFRVVRNLLQVLSLRLHALAFVLVERCVPLLGLWVSGFGFRGGSTDPRFRTFSGSRSPVRGLGFRGWGYYLMNQFMTW